ncbi:hypothetical protein DITRI_Ditri02bG0170200 [Diplodiscus trichospermus]
MALRVLPHELLVMQWRDVILKLCSSYANEDNPEDKDAEAQVNAVKGLIFVCEILTLARAKSDIHYGEDDKSPFHLTNNELWGGSISSTRKPNMLESVSKLPNGNVGEEKQAVEKMDKLREEAA